MEYLSNGGVAENHKDFKELRYNECLSNFSCNNGTSGDSSITHSFQLKSAYESAMPFTNYTYDFKVCEDRMKYNNNIKNYIWNLTLWDLLILMLLPAFLPYILFIKYILINYQGI